MKKQPPDVFYKKDVLKNFANFTGKKLCRGLFFNKVAGLSCLLNWTVSVEAMEDMIHCKKLYRQFFLKSVSFKMNYFAEQL